MSRRLWAAQAGLVIVALSVGFGRAAPDRTPASARKATFDGAAAPTTTVAPSTSGCANPPTVSSTIPKDMAAPVSQANANCFAWQEFIALNWLADPTTCAASGSATAAQFGVPNDMSPVVWETYRTPEEVFLPGAVPPAGWCTQQPLPPKLKALPAAKGLQATSSEGFKSLTMDSKFADGPPLELNGFTEAGTNGAWLTDQAGQLTMYEIRMNQDEFSYIDTNKLYDARNQAPLATSAAGINLPDQFSTDATVGSIELKAAWVELDDPATWPMFKTSKAIVDYPSDPDHPKVVTVGLVGLHIIHKTASGQQFIWGTFEHVDNDPSTSDIKSGNLLPSYTYYNQNCNPSTDHYRCVANAMPQPGKDPYSAPVQVVREQPIESISSDNVAGLNQYAWQQISAANPSSVFLNYELVNTLWPNNNTIVNPAATVPLPSGNPQPPPSQIIVANTTMETYFQTMLTCSDCHDSAPIATVKGRTDLLIVPNAITTTSRPTSTTGSPPSSSTTSTTAAFGADYSFLLNMAHSSAVSGTQRAKSAPTHHHSNTGGFVAFGAVVAVVLVGGGAALAAKRRVPRVAR